MTRVHVFVNNVKTKIISTEVKREGDRGIDEVRIELPACSAIAVSDCIQVIQDAVNLDCLVGAYMMQGIIKDESGKMNNAFGEIAIPRADFIINWCATCAKPVNTGFVDLCTVTNNCVTAGTGKVTSNSMVFVAACTQNIVLSNECLLDFTKTGPFSISFWARSSTTGQAGGIISKASGNFNTTGWQIGKRSADDMLRFNFADTCDNGLDIRWPCMSPITDNIWRNYVLTYNGNQFVSGVKMYENGVEETVNSVQSDNMACAGVVTNSCPVTIGSQADCADYVDIELDDIRIMRGKTISAEEARAIFNRGVNRETPGKFGCAICFNGIESNAFIPDTTCFDFCGQFDIQLWAKWSTTSEGYILDKRSCCSVGFSIKVNGFATGNICASVGALLYTVSGTFNDDEWHFIRLYRDANNLTTLAVDNIDKQDTTVITDLSTAAPLVIGAKFNGGSYFDGQINVIRIYKGKTLSTDQATRIFSCVTATSLMKLGGTVTKVKQQIVSKEVLAQSYGQILGTAEVRTQTYNCKTPEFIIEDLILNNTSLIPHFHGCASGIIVKRFNADGKLIDLLRDLTQMSSKTFDTDPLNRFHLHDPLFNCTCFVFTHGICAQNFDEVDDDTEIINDMLILGEIKRYDTIESFTGDAVKTSFCLVNSPIGGKVLINTIEQEPEVCYVFCALNSILVFACAPSCGAAIIADYEYDLTLIVKGDNQCSISTHGQRSKRLIMPWIRDRVDGVKFVSNYLNRFKDIRTAYKVTLGVMKNSVREGDVVTLVNDIKCVNSTFVVKSITWKYPEMKTELLLGEFMFDDLEYEAQITGKIHDLESVLGEVKTIVCGETVLETLVLTDAIVVEDATASGTLYTEALGMTDTITIIVTAQGIYGDGVTEYAGDFVYASG